MKLQIRPHLFLRNRLWHCVASGCAGVPREPDCAAMHLTLRVAGEVDATR